MTISSGMVGALGGVLIVLFAAAAVFGQFRISRNTATVTNYRESAKAWEMRSDAQEKEIEQLKEELASKDDRIGELEKQVTELRGHMNALQEMMIGAGALEQLRTEITTARDTILQRLDARPA